MAIPTIRKSWGFDDDTALADFSSQVYAAKFSFISGSPGYTGTFSSYRGMFRREMLHSFCGGMTPVGFSLFRAVRLVLHQLTSDCAA